MNLAGRPGVVDLGKLRFDACRGELALHQRRIGGGGENGDGNQLARHVATHALNRPGVYAVIPLVNSMNAVSKLTSSSRNKVSLWPAPMSKPARSL